MRDRYVWYPYLEKPFPWVLVAIYLAPLLVVAGLVTVLAAI